MTNEGVSVAGAAAAGAAAAGAATPSEAPAKVKKRKERAGAITEQEYRELKESFDLITGFFDKYASFHKLSHGFVTVIRSYGPLTSEDLEAAMQEHQNSEVQFVQRLRGREQTLKTMEAVCLERWAHALRSLYHVRQVSDLAAAIEAQDKSKSDILRKHSAYQVHEGQRDETEFKFTLTDGKSVDLQGIKRDLEPRLKDRERRLALESLALRALRQLLKITSRTEEQVKNWKAHRSPS